MIDSRYEYLDRRALEGELNRWGHWIERHSDYQGYPTINPVEAYRSGGGGGQPGHRILCLDMPTDVYSIHNRWLMLSEIEREAIWVYYVTRVKDDGTVWTVEERCNRLGITTKTLRNRLSSARQRLLGLVASRETLSGMSQVLSPASSG